MNDEQAARSADLGSPDPVRLDDLLRRALAEDAPWGDVTSEMFVPPGALATADLVSREPGVLSGIHVAARVFRLVDDRIHVVLHTEDGARIGPGDRLATITGPARGVLRAERVALNLAQRMTGIATLTARYVSAVQGTGVGIVDTRKTTPGLRELERYAVRCGGGRNHRFSLSDAVLAKDNHLAVLQAASVPVGEAVRRVRHRLGHTVHFEVEVDRLDQIDEVVAAGVDTIMLDNFAPDELRRGVALVAGRARIEASGGVTLDTVREIAETGVDLVSVGALTHSAPALDLGLDLSIRGVDDAAGETGAR